MAQTILLFEISKEKKGPLKDICRGLGITMREVRPGDYRQTLGFLTRIGGFPRKRTLYEGEAFPEEMLVFSGMDSEHLDQFLDAYKQRGLSPIALKAVLTPHNVQWTAEQLYAEIRREHSEFSKNY